MTALGAVESLQPVAAAELVKTVSSRLDLRPPNSEALECLAFELAQHYDVDGKPSPFECVIDSATGVGKTFILLAGIEYLAAALGVRNFIVIAPGSTIRDKTIGHFTPGHRKSLLTNMESQPYLVTAGNFQSPVTRAALDDDSRVKVYVFTVQALTKPTTKQGRRTHVFQEGLGAGFYQHLASLDDLVVFADESHCYSGPEFSKAINDLDPLAIIGLTATPDRRTPEEQIIYRYPLAAAIADRWVKTPVIVARRDDRNDEATKLADGLTLLGYKKAALDAYCTENGLPAVNPVMLIVARNTDEANVFAERLRSEEFDGGNWRDAVLLVHSNLTGDKKEEALAALEAVEDPHSPIRVIISVGMLKEGWDVKNVYVIASMRPSFSDVLTEQTLGRGLRLPFGRYTGIEILDTLEVLAHEKYDALLKNAGVLNEQFIDRRTRAVLRKNVAGRLVVVTETEQVSTQVVGNDDPTGVPAPSVPGTTVPAPDATQPTAGGAVQIRPVDARARALDEQSQNTAPDVVAYKPLDTMPAIRVPALRMTSVETRFSLADITDLDAFRKLGRQVAAAPENELRRVRVSARVVVGADGLRRTELVTGATVDQLAASSALFPLVELQKDLVDAVLAAPIVPKRKDQARPAGEIVEAFVEGVGSDAERILSAFSGRAAARLVKLVTDEHRKFLAQPQFEEVVELETLSRTRESKRRVNLERTGPFAKSAAYDSFDKSYYGVDWFDSEPERAFANIVEDSSDVRCWVRLQTGEVKILWRSDGREYNADLIVVEGSGDHWVVEIKADDTAGTLDVQAKRQAAKRWVNHVNASDRVDVRWHYLLLTESDIKQAQGSWSVLKKLGT